MQILKQIEFRIKGFPYAAVCSVGVDKKLYCVTLITNLGDETTYIVKSQEIIITPNKAVIELYLGDDIRDWEKYT